MQSFVALPKSRVIAPKLFKVFQIALLLLLLLLTGCGGMWSAVITGDVEKLRTALAKGGDPNTITARGTTPLCAAIENDSVNIARTLVNGGADVNLECQYRNTYNNRNHPLIHIYEDYAKGENQKSDEDLARLVMFESKALKLSDDQIVHLLNLVSTMPDRARFTDMALVFGLSARGPTFVEELVNSRLLTAVCSHDPSVVAQLLARSQSPERTYTNVGYTSGPASPDLDEWPLAFFARACRGSGSADALAIEALLPANPNPTSKSGKTWDEAWAAAAPIMAERRRLQAEQDAEWARQQAEYAAENRAEEAREQEQAQARYQEFYTNYQNTVMGGTTPEANNPVDDNSFQERMAAMAREPREAETGNAATAEQEAVPSASAERETVNASTAEREAAEQRRRDDEQARVEERRVREAAEAAARVEQERRTQEEAAAARVSYLQSVVRNTRLAVVTCGGEWMVSGKTNFPSPRLTSGVNLDFEYRCPGPNGPRGTGTGFNWVGNGPSCFGDTVKVSELSCEPSAVQVIPLTARPMGVR